MNKHNCTCKVLAIIAAFGITMPVSSAVLEEVIVTAQKREQSMQDVALSITALSKDAIEKRGLEGFRDWSDYVPGITMFQGQDSNRRTGPSATIRGVTHVSAGHLFEGSSTATTSYTIGQVPFFNGDPGLYDLNRIEVLRGPQGTLYGISSMGGTVRFIPNEARTDEFEAEIGTGGGLITDGGSIYNVSAMMNVPIIEDVLAVRLAARHRHNGGWIDQFFPGLESADPLRINGVGFDPRVADETNTDEDANAHDVTGGRFSFTYTPTDSFSLKGFTTWQKTDYKTQMFEDLNDQRDEPVITRYTLQPMEDEYIVNSLEASLDVGNIGSLEFVGGYYWSRNSETVDITRQVATVFLSGAVPALDADGPGGLPSDPIPTPVSFPFVTESSIYSAELRLQGENKSLGNLFGNDMRLDYVIGGFFQSEGRDGVFNISSPDWNANRGPNTVPILTDGGVILSSRGGSYYENKAVFGDITLHLTEKLSIGGGIRYFDQKRDSNEFRFGDWYSGRAANGATVGDDLTADDVVNNLGTVQESGITPRATVSYRFDDDRMVYYTASQGKRIPAGFPNPIALEGRPPECTTLAEQLGVLDDAINGTVSDSVWSHEVGLKSNWMDNSLLFNAAAYYLIWSDFQQIVQLTQFNAACNAQLPANVGEIETKGFELEMVYSPTENWVFNTAIAHTDAAFSDVIPGAVSSSIPGVFLEKGDSIRAVSPWTASVGAEYRFDIPSFWGNEFSGYVRADWRYVAERSFSFGDKELLRADPSRRWYFADAYNLTDVRLGVENETWAMSLYASNIFNQEGMYSSRQDFHQPNIRAGSVAQPRTVGFSIKRFF